MVKIRLTRLGRHKVPFYRIIACDSRKKRDCGYLQLLGTYEPKNNIVKLEKQKIIDCLSNGAQPTESVLNILKKNGVYAEYLNTKKSAN